MNNITEFYGIIMAVWCLFFIGWMLAVGWGISCEVHNNLWKRIAMFPIYAIGVIGVVVGLFAVFVVLLPYICEKYLGF